MERQDKTEGRTGYTAGAEGLDSLTLGAPNRSAGESQEDILPKMPENGVLVRKDIVSLEFLPSPCLPCSVLMLFLVYDLRSGVNDSMCFYNVQLYS